jgi:hypothetical protein
MLFVPMQFYERFEKSQDYQRAQMPIPLTKSIVKRTVIIPCVHLNWFKNAIFCTLRLYLFDQSTKKWMQVAKNAFVPS